MNTDSVMLPEEFLQRMEQQLGRDFPDFLAALQSVPPTSVRLNPFKKTNKFDAEESVPWCQHGRYLEKRPSFTFDPLFHAGAYYVQEASSMFLEQIWKAINPEAEAVRVLDLCAAPGGKSTHLLSLMSEDSLLVSNEVIPNRNKILRQNIVKWGTANSVVTQNKPEDFGRLENFFDLIVVDAPCSGEGLFRKDKKAMDEWSEQNVVMCAHRQSEILKHAVQCLKPGGFLIYSTCTFEPSENDEQVAQLGLEKIRVEVPDWGQSSTEFGFQFYPHRTKGEGFYISVLQKPETGHAPFHPTSLPGKHPMDEILEKYLFNPQQFISYEKNEMLFAIPKSIFSDFRLLEKHLYIRQAGLLMGTSKKKNFVPSHDLALSCHLRSDLSYVELTEEEAISYLRCETPKISVDTLGWCLARFEQKNLGWMKILDGRINNYFPKDWRILKQNQGNA